MTYHSSYKGCNIYFKTGCGYGLKWSSYVNGMFVCADTLRGIKGMITGDIK